MKNFPAENHGTPNSREGETPGFPEGRLKSRSPSGKLVALPLILADNCDHKVGNTSRHGERL